MKTIYSLIIFAIVGFLIYISIPQGHPNYQSALLAKNNAAQRAVIYELWDYYERHGEFPLNLHQIERYSTNGHGFYDSLSDRYYDWHYLYPGRIDKSEYKSKIPVIIMPTTFYDKSYTNEKGMGDLKFIGYLNGEIEPYKAGGGFLRYYLNTNNELEVSPTIAIPYTKNTGQQDAGG